MVKKALKSLMLFGLSIFALTGCDVPVLQPQGPVAEKQFHMIIWSSILMLFVLLTVFTLFGFVVFKYRANRANDDDYEPDLEGNTKLEILWTTIPIIIILLLAIPTVITIHDSMKNPSPDKKPITIEVTSAEWKWLFRYPEQGIETVNEVHIPADRPVHFVLTSAGAMNSFWVPSLGGQMYTMPDMKTELWLEADKPGRYDGRAANFNGENFAHMTFTVVAQKQADFDKWADKVKAEAPALTMKEYKKLLKPGLVGKKVYSSYPAELEHASDMDMPGMKGGEASEHGKH